MKEKILTLIILFFIFNQDLFSQNSTSKEKLLRCENIIKQKKYNEAIEILNEMKNSHSEDLKYHFLKAIAYEGINNVESRKIAAGEYRHIIKLDSKNKLYRYKYGLLLKKQGYIYNSEKEFKSILKLDSLYVPAIIELASINIEKSFDLKNSRNLGALWSLKNESNRYRNVAEKYLHSGLVCDSENETLLFLQGKLYLHEKKYNSMEKSFLKAIMRNNRKMDYHLILGYAYLKQNKFSEAIREFDNAKSLMNKEMKTAIESLDGVILSSKSDSFSSEKSDSLRSIFWRKRDPLYLTDYNERKIEHYARFAYATLMFSGTNNTDIPGWKTEQGKIILRYGEPRFFSKTRMTNKPRLSNYNMDLTWVLTRRTMNYIGLPRMIWFYDNFTFTFEDRTLSGNYTLINMMPRGDDPNWVESPSVIYETLKQNSPEIYNSPYENIKIKNDAQYYSFKAPGGNTDIDFYYSLPIRNSKNYQKSVYNYYTLHEGGFLFDLDWNIYKKMDRITKLIHEPKRETMPHPIINKFSFTIPPGSYNYAIEFKDNDNTIFCSKRDSLTVPYFISKDIEMSDIVLGIIADNAGISFQRYENNEFIPLPYNVISKNDKFNIYFEIYNLAFNRKSKTKFEITTSIKPFGEKGELKNIISKLFKKNKNGKSLSNIYTFQGESPTEKRLYGLDLTSLKPGNYVLSCTIKDEITGTSTSKSRNFILVDFQNK